MDPQGKLYVRTVARALEQELSKRPQLDFTPIRHLLEPVGPQLDRLARANGLIGEAHDLMNNLEVQKALEKFEQAARLQRSVFHLLAATQSGVEEHGKIYVDLSIGNFLAGNEQAARDALHQAMVLIPKLEYDPKKFPPQMKRMFDEVRFLVDELGGGDLRVDTDPGGAEVSINGNFVGFSPVVARGQTAGPNLVTVAKPGYRTKTGRTRVKGGDRPDSVRVKLQPIAPQLRQSLTRALQEARARRPGAALASLAKWLDRGMLFVADTASRDDLVTVTLYAYDARHNRIFSGSQATVSALDPEAECRNLVDSLLPFITWHPPRTVARRKASWWSRVRSSPYFWPAVGAVAGAVVIGASVGLGVYFGTRDDDDRGRNVLILPAGVSGY